MARRGRRLTEDERALWRKVASTTSRRAPKPPVAPEADPPAPREMDLRTETALPPSPRSILKPLGRREAQIALPSAPPPAPSGLDRATETRLRKGRKDPEARLDLHGMTAQRAHAALTRFVSQSRAQGLRLVLVITGKGGPAAPRAFGDPSPGVLRREAPVWLSTEPLASMVVNVSQAHPRHGGGGALYVYLKRKR